MNHLLSSLSKTDELPLPLPPKNKVPLRRLCPNTLRQVTYMAYNHVHPVLQTILEVPGDAQVHYGLLMHYYKITGYRPPSSAKYRKLTEDEEQTIVQMHLQGASLTDIAEHLGRRVSTIHYAIRRLCKK